VKLTCATSILTLVLDSQQDEVDVRVVLAPALFNLAMDFIMDSWHFNTRITDLNYADDIVLLSTEGDRRRFCQIWSSCFLLDEDIIRVPGRPPAIS